MYVDENIKFHNKLSEEYGIAEVELALAEIGFGPKSISRFAPRLVEQLNKELQEGTMKKTFLKLYVKNCL